MGVGRWESACEVGGADTSLAKKIHKHMNWIRFTKLASYSVSL